MTLLFVILTKNDSFRSYGTFAYFFRAHIRNIYKYAFVHSARGHELSGRVRTHAYNYINYNTYYAWAKWACDANKLLITT